MKLSYEKKEKNMKKITTVFLFIFALFTITMLSGCQKAGGESKTSAIVFQSLCHPVEDGITLTLNLDCYIAGAVPPMANQKFIVTEKEIPNLYLDNGQYSNTDGAVALYEVLKDAKLDERITNIELIDNRYILISTDIPDLRYVMIFRSSIFGGDLSESDDLSKRGVSFDYMPLQGKFYNRNIFTDIPNNHWQIDGTNIAAYVPYHLFNDYSLFYQYAFKHLGGLLKNNHLSHQERYNYKIDSDITDFRAFYESLDLYEISEENNRLTFKGIFYKRDGSSTVEEGRPTTEIVSPVNGIMTLDFTEEDGQRYVAYSFETE